MSTEAGRIVIRVPKAETTQTAARLLTELPVADLTIEDPPIEDVIEQVFREG
jgi:ABC-2 type transport system ATP-binding protein